MKKSIAIMVLGSPYANSSTHTALHFAQSVIAEGNAIVRLFFYHESVTVGSELCISAQDEINLPAAWQTFIDTHKIDTVVCIASALKRGIVDAAEAKRYNKSQFNLHGTIELSGLGQWIDAVNSADKSIVFGA